jgi:glycosyltransferase involved in cell wall biosynthesis
MQRATVAILLPTLLIGGAEKSLVELANGLAHRGWNIHLLVMAKQGLLIAKLDPKVDLIDLGCSSYRQTVLALARYYKERRPALILSSLYATGLAAIAAKVISRYKPKVIVGAHNSLRAKSVNPDNVKDRFFLMALCRLLFPLADGFIPVSMGLARELEVLFKLPKNRIRTIYNPVVTPQLTALAEEQVSHPWLDKSREGQFMTVVSVGRLVEQKGYDVLLEALCRVRRSIDCRLIIVGGGPLHADLNAMTQRLGLEAFVDLLGWQENPYKYVARADLFVLSSRWEGLANVVIEALACGCPVVATDCNYGPYEILEGGRHGGLAANESPDDLASKILLELGKESATGASRDIRKSRARDFTAAAAVEQYSRFFSTCAA